MLKVDIRVDISQPIFTSSNLAIGILEEDVNLFKVNDDDNKTMSIPDFEFGTAILNSAEIFHRQSKLDFGLFQRQEKVLQLGK